MNKRELKRLSRADLLEMLIIKCRENDQLRAELEAAKAGAVQRPVKPQASDEQVAQVLRALQTAAERYLNGTPGPGENAGSASEAHIAKTEMSMEEDAK